MDIVLATRNAGKLSEIATLLRDLPIRTRSLTSFENLPVVEEDQDTLEGNATKKARVIADLLSLPVLADDTGLEVDCLDGKPGVYSARYAGPAEDPAANRTLLLSELEHCLDRSARFRTVIAYVDRGSVRLFEGVCSGRIASEERGEHGFGYDALFIPDGMEETFAELDPEKKNRISHRGRALEKFIGFLTEQLRKTQ